MNPKISVIEDKSRLEDRAKLIGLVSEQMKIIGSQKSLSEVESAVEHALESNSRAVFFLYKAEDEPAAFAFGNICAGLESGSDYLWLNELYVDEEYRRSSIATELVSFIERWVRQKDISYIACITGKKNTAAQSFFGKKGYDLSTTIWVDKTVE